MLDEVVHAIIESLEDNPLILNYQELKGMLYYLTGTCHINWHASA